MIAIVDYGAGNLRSVANALRFIGAEARITADPAELAAARGIILPGVGAFPNAAAALESAGLTQALCQLAGTKPFLGICLGMQLLFDMGHENSPCPGLGLLPGEVRRMETSYKLPQIGWNSLRVLRPCALTRGLSGGEYVYFVHSYAARPGNAADVCAVTDYGPPVTALVARGRLFGCQFHPEKSGDPGLLMLRNFNDICNC